MLIPSDISNPAISDIIVSLVNIHVSKSTVRSPEGAFVLAYEKNSRCGGVSSVVHVRLEGSLQKSGIIEPPRFFHRMPTRATDAGNALFADASD